LHVLAQAVFGKRKPGPQKGRGSASWWPGKKIYLGALHREIRRRNPKWSNEKIAAVISDEIEEFKPHHKDPRAVRKQLPEARRELELWERGQAAKRVARDVNQLREWLREPAFRELILREPGVLKLLLSVMQTEREREVVQQLPP
jgi:hypothetical protein